MVLKNIRNLFKSSPLLYVFLLLTQIVGVIVIMFAYSVYMNNQYSMDAARLEGQIFKVSLLDTGEGILAQEVRDAFPGILSEYEDILDYCKVDSSTYDEDGNISTMDDRRAVYAGSLFSVKEGKYIYSDELTEEYVEGSTITEEYMNSGERVCVLSRYLYEKWGNPVVFGEDTYEVIGYEPEEISESNSDRYYGLDSVRIPVEALPEAAYRVSVSVYFNRVLTSHEFKDLRDKFTDSFTVINEMTEGYTVSADVQKSLKTMMLAVVFMALVSAYSSVKFYGYILEKRRKMTAVYRICGATKLRAFSLYITEVFCYQLFTTIVGVLVFMKIMLPELITKYKFLIMIFESNDCYKLILMYSAIVFALSAVSIVVSVLRTPIQTLKEN